MDEAVEKNGITITDEEVLQRVTELAESQTPKLTVEQFLKAIEAKGISIPDYEVMLKRQMAWDKLVEPKIAGKYEVTEEEALQYFKDHPNNFGDSRAC